jgi:5,10-methylenetetrahydromethanopterin reductase
LHDKLRAYQQRFDYSEKGTSAQNGPLMEELGLADYFTERFGVVGTPDEVVARLRELEAIGVNQVSLASHNRGLAGVPDSVELLGRHVLPHVSGSAAVGEAASATGGTASAGAAASTPAVATGV